MDTINQKPSLVTITLQKDKCLRQKDKKIAILENKVEKLQSRLKKKEEGAKITLTKWDGEINPTAIFITQICQQVYAKFPYGGKEHHYQALLEAELHHKGFDVQSEVAVVYKVMSTSGEILQLPHDIRGREDLLLSREKMILELKQTKGIGDKENQQILRYMNQRRRFSNWGLDTTGMLINFGDENLEIWFIKYNTDGEIEHVKLLDVPIVVHKSWETNAFIKNC